ncbi:MAG: efflux RND transporter periplasmic adaptor subunit [Thiohalocapsa sp.]|nr:efflux RND transporter periplasmic adaptor subunit [Thiohalocapsa sp.]
MTPARNPKVLLSFAVLVLTPMLAIPAAGLLAGDRGSDTPIAETVAPALAVRVIEIALADGYDLRRIFTGRVEAERSSGPGFERSGLLREVRVAEGDRVAAGQVLARLDTALLQARRRELEAVLDAAEADLALARATLARYRGSVDRGAVTRQALDEAGAGERAAEAASALARARIASVDVDLAKSELTAPFAGVVIARAADEGRVLAAGSPVIELQALSTPEVRVGLAARVADGLTAGATYELRWREQVIPARLRTLLPVRAARARTVDALFVPLQAPDGLRPGELVELRLSEHVPEPGVWLPLSALAEGVRGLWQAYALQPLAAGAPDDIGADHRIRPVPVEVLHQDGDRAYVRGPFAAGTPVVAGGLHRVVPGQLVRALPSAGAEIAGIVMEGR